MEDLVFLFFGGGSVEFGWREVGFVGYLVAGMVCYFWGCDERELAVVFEMGGFTVCE